MRDERDQGGRLGVAQTLPHPPPLILRLFPRLSQFVGLPGAHAVKGCNDDVWPDGEGSFHLLNATALGMEELVRRMDQLDWTEGITIRAARVAGQQCDGTHQLGSCYPELEFGAGSTAPFGFNHTDPDFPMNEPWSHFTSEELGANPNGITSAAIPSMRQYETAGFVALVIPFFSDTFLPEQRYVPCMRRAVPSRRAHTACAEPCPAAERTLHAPSRAQPPSAHCMACTRSSRHAASATTEAPPLGSPPAPQLILPTRTRP